MFGNVRGIIKVKQQNSWLDQNPQRTFTIRQEDYAYVLSGFVAEPIRWVESFGWRALQPLEQKALFLFWDHVGSLMHLEQRPRSLQQLMELNQRANVELFASAESNQCVAEATVAMLLAPWPAALHRWLRSIMCSLLEPETLSSLHWTRLAPLHCCND